MRQNVIGKLLRKLISDFESPQNSAIFSKREIKGLVTQISVKLSKRNDLYFSIQSENVILLLRAGGVIKAGQLVSATNHDLLIETGDIMAALERPDDAIKDYDEAISCLSEPDKLKTAWNNKGLVLYSLKKWDKAIKCYDEALKIDLFLKEAWFNRGLAYA
jgi:tetratricopeptide (TPR) repeat protein